MLTVSLVSWRRLPLRLLSCRPRDLSHMRNPWPSIPRAPATPSRARPVRALFKAMDGKGSLLVLEGPPTLPTASNRFRGFRDALKDFPNIQVMMSKNANYARPVALDLFKTMLKLSNPPQVDGVLAANDA